MSAPVAEQLDEIRRSYDAKALRRDAAITQIRRLADITDLGAADLLDDPRMPSARYAEVVGPRPCPHCPPGYDCERGHYATTDGAP